MKHFVGAIFFGVILVFSGNAFSQQNIELKYYPVNYCVSWTGVPGPDSFPPHVAGCGTDQYHRPYTETVKVPSYSQLQEIITNQQSQIEDLMKRVKELESK